MQGSRLRNEGTQGMHRKIISTVTALAVVATGIFGIAPVAYADEAEIKFESDEPSVGGTPEITDAENTLEIPVNTTITGSGGLVYNISLTWGPMSFKYNYGGAWNPLTHRYSSSQSGGWDTSCVTGTNTRTENDYGIMECTKVANNGISIINHSNYPITADFKYEVAADVFNANTASPSAVVGIFNEDNDTLQATVIANSTDATNAPDATKAITLAMDTNKLEAGQKYYAVADANQYYGDMYFALVGTPDRNKKMATATQTGSITVTVTPARGASIETK